MRIQNLIVSITAQTLLRQSKPEEDILSLEKDVKKWYVGGNIDT